MAVTPTPETARSGKIVISFQGRDTQTWEAMCDAYTERNPDVECVVELKPSEGYQEWIRTQFASGVPEASFVNANVVADLVNDKRFLDLAAYLDQTSPYTNQPWREDMDDAALANMRNPVTGATYMLNLETVQVLWFYNKSAFADAGILEDAEALAQTPRNQPTWDQFMGWCDALNEAGYIPVSIAGDYDSFWSGALGWLAHVCRPIHPPRGRTVRCQEGDYCFREGIDDCGATTPPTPTTTTPPISRLTSCAKSLRCAMAISVLMARRGAPCTPTSKTLPTAARLPAGSARRMPIRSS
ncbi:MAG: ABC transporter substrate-binding protein [Caldilineaceae bacterium]